MSLNDEHYMNASLFYISERRKKADETRADIIY